MPIRRYTVSGKNMIQIGWAVSEIWPVKVKNQGARLFKQTRLFGEIQYFAYFAVIIRWNVVDRGSYWPRITGPLPSNLTHPIPWLEVVPSCPLTISEINETLVGEIQEWME